MEVCWYGPQPRRFARPVATIEARDLADVIPALMRADTALADGYSIAGYLTYDAGAALVGRAAREARTPTPRALPLLALGIYRPSAGTPPSRDDPHATAELGPLVTEIDADRYARDLEEIQRALHAGDVYQVNYTVPFAFTFSGDPHVLFARLHARGNVPYAAYVRHGKHALLSLSPERFFDVDGDRLHTRPMKGTSEPHRTAELASSKNRAEHVMIVDLLRNDMHRVCDAVAVAPLFEIETYPTFATMTSTLAGRLRPDVPLSEIFAALFPCGSITGAPKTSAMATIARCEGEARGIAMGTIGYCDGPRRGQWNVAIRTAALDCATGRGEVRIGGGIVADSTPQAEWAEVLVKRRAFADDVRAVGLIETLRIACDGTYEREAAHRERLARSAFALGIPCDEALLVRALATRRAAFRLEPALVRLELKPDGGLSARERALEAVPPHPTLCIATRRLAANDPTLRHKTTARAVYDAASAEARALGCFDAIVLNEDGACADAARTTLFVARADGVLQTPPLRAGALAGILRAELLASGRAVESALGPRDLVSGELFVGNAARGLIAVTLRVG